MSFNSESWIEEKRYELTDKLFKNCFNIENFLTNKNNIIYFDDLQKKELIEKINEYRPALYQLFGSSCLRSTLNYYYTGKDKRPVLNLIKQLLHHFEHGLESESIYSYSSGRHKIYKTCYKIIKVDSHEHSSC